MVPKGQRVRLTFTSFDLVPEVCGDFVQVFDGYTAGSSSLGKYDISDPLPVCREEQEESLIYHFLRYTSRNNKRAFSEQTERFVKVQRMW